MCGGLSAAPLHGQDDDPTPERPENLQTRLVEETQKPKKGKMKQSAGAAESLQESAGKSQAAAAIAAAADSVVQPQVSPFAPVQHWICLEWPLALLSSCCCRAVHTLRATCIS